MSASDLHATAVVLGEAGVLIRGDAGSGKSSLALALLGEAVLRGWYAALVGDDRVAVLARHGRLVARGHPAILGRIERRGEGLLAVPYAGAARLCLVVDLLPPDEMPRLPEPGAAACTLVGIALPRLLLPAGDTRADTPARVLDILITTGQNGRRLVASHLPIPVPHPT